MVSSKITNLNHLNVLFGEMTLPLKWTHHLNLLHLNSLQNASEMPTVKVVTINSSIKNLEQ